MYRQIIVIFFCLLGVANAPAWAVDGAAAPAQARGALFKVDGGGHTLYLFGTMHVGLPSFYPLEPRMGAALAGASALALEIDPLADPAAMAAGMREYGISASANEAIPAPTRQRLERILRQRGIDPAAVAQLRPWLVAMVLALGEFGQLGYRADLAVDAHLAGIAHGRKIKVVELESISSQLGLFSRLSAEEQWRYLDETLDGIESGQQAAQVREVIDAWSHADQAALEAIAARAEADTTVSGRFIQRVMLDERNGPLADKLRDLLRQENQSVAGIGVLHLVGKHSVPALLRERGLSVERVY